MSTANSKANPAPVVGQPARKAAKQPAIQLLGRFGYAAKGVVYIIIGTLAALAAIGDGGTTTDRKGAIQAVYDQPAGKFLLGVVAVGLIGYAIWCVIRATADTEAKGSDAKGIAVRLFYLAVAVSYGALAFGAFKLIAGAGNSGKSSDTNAQDWTAELLKQPFGTLLVIVAALIVLGVAGYQFYRAFSGKFQKHLELGQMNAQTKQWVTRFGQFGLSARGVVFGVIGIFLIVAALQHDAGQAKGLGGALQELTLQPYGRILLGVVAVGLIAYGFFCLAEARYRRMIETGKSQSAKSKTAN